MKIVFRPSVLKTFSANDKACADDFSRSQMMLVLFSNNPLNAASGPENSVPEAADDVGFIFKQSVECRLRTGEFCSRNWVRSNKLISPGMICNRIANHFFSRAGIYHDCMLIYRV